MAGHICNIIIIHQPSVTNVSMGAYHNVCMSWRIGRMLRRRRRVETEGGLVWNETGCCGALTIVQTMHVETWQASY